MTLMIALLLQADPKPWRDFELSVGGFITELNSEIEILSASGLGSSVDVENALGLENSLSQLRIWGSVALGERHRLSFGYVDLTRSGSKAIEVDLTIGDRTFTAGTVVDSTLELQLGSLTYGYSVLYDARMDVEITFGVHMLRTRFEAEASGAGAESESFMLPVPLPGFRASFALTPSLILRQSFEALYLRYANFQGLLFDTTLALEWRAFEHVGFGLGFNAVRVRMAMEEDSLPAVDFDGRFEADFSGLLLYTTVYF